MNRKRSGWSGAAVLAVLLGWGAGVWAQVAAVSPGTMKRLGTVDERYQSYNIEMLEVTGGDFWKPYASVGKPVAGPAGVSVPVGMDPLIYEYRAPINLGGVRLRKLAAELGPAYVRVSGTWANSTYFQTGAGPALKTPPEGFKGVLTEPEWRGVIDFAKVADAKIVTSFATSDGTRDGKGAWTPKEAEKFLAFTKAAGGTIAAAEFMNEPTFAGMGGAPKGYDGAAYGRDVAVFRPYLKKASPGTLLVGPGAVGEGGPLAMPSLHLLPTEDLLGATGPVDEVFSYHFYGGVSERCSKGMPKIGTTVGDALTAKWMGETEEIEAYYQRLRDRFEPGIPMWVTETGETACGGDPWAKTFLDSFRYLNQLGALAQRGVQVVMHNTLAASDYGLLDEKTYEPRPNYWSAVLWRRLMGRTVLSPGDTVGSAMGENVHVYAHCLRGVEGGVALLAINADTSKTATLKVGMKAERYTLSAAELQSGQVRLNGTELRLGTGDALPSMKGLATAAGDVVLAPETITFLAVAGAGNRSCAR